MSWFQKISATKAYLGDCRTCLENPQFWGIATDATELAQIIENGTEIDFGSFFAAVAPTPLLAEIRHSPDRYGFFQNGRLMWAYDEEEDVHHFFW